MLLSSFVDGIGARVALPPNQSSLGFWFTAQDINLLGNVGISDGASISTWKNKGTFGATGDAAVTSTATFKKTAQSGKLNNKSSVTFNGTATKFTSGTVANIAQPNMIMVIFKSTTTATQILVDGNNDTNREAIYLDTSNVVNLYAGAGNLAPWGPPQPNTYNFVVATFNGTSTRVKVNNWTVATPDGTPGALSLDGIQFGTGRGGGFLAGEIVEVLVWHGTLPTEDSAAAYALANYGSTTFPAAVAFDGGTGKITIAGGNHVAFFGDSLTASGATGLWHQQAGGYVDQVNAGVNTPIVVVNSGVGGNTAALLDARVNTDIVGLSPQPNAVLITDVYNDWNQHITLSAFIASVRSVISKLKAITGVKIAWLNLLSAANEQFPDPNYLTLSAYNNCLAQACLETSNCTIVDITTAKEAYEQINNVPPPGLAQGQLTQDTVHPSIPTGKLLMGNQAFARTTLVP